MQYGTRTGVGRACTTGAARRCARTYDSQMTEQALGWRPVADRPTMEQRGIADAVKWFLR